MISLTSILTYNDDRQRVGGWSLVLDDVMPTPCCTDVCMSRVSTLLSSQDILPDPLPGIEPMEQVRAAGASPRVHLGGIVQLGSAPREHKHRCSCGPVCVLPCRVFWVLQWADMVVLFRLAGGYRAPFTRPSLSLSFPLSLSLPLSLPLSLSLDCNQSSPDGLEMPAPPRRIIHSLWSQSIHPPPAPDPPSWHTRLLRRTYTQV